MWIPQFLRTVGAKAPLHSKGIVVARSLCCFLVTGCDSGDLLTHAEQNQPQTATLTVDFQADGFSTHATGGPSHNPLAIYLSYPVTFGNQQWVVSVVATSAGLFLSLGSSRRQIFPLAQAVVPSGGSNRAPGLSREAAPARTSGGTLDLFGYQRLQNGDITGEDTLGDINTYHVQGQMPPSIDLTSDLGTVNEDLWINQDNYYPVRFAFQNDGGPSMTVNYSNWDTPPPQPPGSGGENSRQNGNLPLAPLARVDVLSHPGSCQYTATLGFPLVFDINHTCVGDAIDIANGASASLSLLAAACKSCVLPAVTVAAILVVYASWLDWADRHGAGGAIVKVYPFFNATTFIPFVWVEQR